MVGISYVVEVIQPWNDRSKDFFDAWANTAGIGVGAGIGFLSRLAVNFLWGEWQNIRTQRYLKVFRAGDVILGAGQQAGHFYIIKKGSVEVLHNENGVSVPVSTLEANTVFGLVSEALHTKQEETIIAKEECTVYELDYDAIIQEAGGEQQPISLLLKTLIKQYDTQIDLLVEEVIETNQTTRSANENSTDNKEDC